MSDETLEKQHTANAIEKTVTAEDVNLVAHKYANDKTVQVLSYHINDYSEDPLGFLGSHRNLRVTLQRSNASSPEKVNFFVKSMPYDCKEQADFLSNEGIFLKESNFFSNIVPQFEKYCKCEKWHPTCYLAKEDSLIMEDLKSQGYQLLKKTFDDTTALKSVLASLARFHSCSLLTEHYLNRNLKRPLTLNEHYPGYFDEKLFTRTSKPMRWVTCGADVTCKVAKMLGYNADKIRKAYEHIYDIIGPSKKYQNVVCHGDPWSNNIMLADDSPLFKCILVDFQVTRYGPPVIDLVQFLHLNATRSYREKNERDLVKHYHSIVKETIEKNDLSDSVKVPTLQEIFMAMNDFRIIGLVTAALYFPIALMDAESAAECTKDSESFNNFMFSDRIQSTLDHMEVNKSYKKSIEEAVIELTEKCDLLY